LLNSLEDKSHVIMSCGGGMPPAVSSDNINAFIDAVKNNS
jgi:uroporphyrinogen decarboxylase